MLKRIFCQIALTFDAEPVKYVLLKSVLKERREDYYYSSWSKQKPLKSPVGHVIWDKPRIRRN